MTLAERLRARLAETSGGAVPYRDDLREPLVGDGIPAAVLMAVTDRAEPGLILTQRPDSMRRHAGQVAFPGGRVDPGDRDAIAAALREAEEEIALPPSAVEVIGQTEPYRTITGFEIAPVLGVIAPDLALVPHDAEVAAVFEVPLAYVLDRANHAERTVTTDGRVRTFIEMHWQDRRIWGATAAILANLAHRLQ